MMPLGNILETLRNLSNGEHWRALASTSMGSNQTNVETGSASCPLFDAGFQASEPEFDYCQSPYQSAAEYQPTTHEDVQQPEQAPLREQAPKGKRRGSSQLAGKGVKRMKMAAKQDYVYPYHHLRLYHCQEAKKPVRMGEFQLPRGNENNLRTRVRHFLTFYRWQMGFVELSEVPQTPSLDGNQIAEADSILSRWIQQHSELLLFWVYAGYREACFCYDRQRQLDPLPPHLEPPEWLRGA
jgi:hypothetical protein